MSGVLRKLLCRFGFCACVTNSDDKAVWGECVHCGRRVGEVSRAAIRRYIEAEERQAQRRSEA